MKKRKFAYSGLLTCAHCGCAITAEKRKGKYVYYHCTGNNGDCPQPYIREKDLEELLYEVIAPIAIDEEVMEWGWKATRMKRSFMTSN